MSQSTGCSHLFPDGTSCRLSDDAHAQVPGLAAVHNYGAGSRMTRPDESDALREAIRIAIRDELPCYVTGTDRAAYAGWGADAVLDVLRDLGVLPPAGTDGLA